MQSSSSTCPCVLSGASAAALLGRRLHSPALRDTVFESFVDVAIAPTLGDHRFDTIPLVPGAYFLTLALEAAHHALRSDECRLEDVSFAEALALPDGEQRTLQLILAFAGEPGAFFKVVSRPSDGSDEPCWTVHATGVLAAPHTTATADSVLTPTMREHLMANAPAVQDADAFYDVLRRRGLLLGPAFRCIESVWRRDDETLCRIQSPDDGSTGDNGWSNVVALDACLQSLCATLPCDDDATTIPVTIDRLEWFGCAAGNDAVVPHASQPCR